MAAIICDVCGGKLSMGAGGVATCADCGMEHSKERIQEKIKGEKGTVQVTDSNVLGNYLLLAQNAYNASNFQEAEAYCNKILEMQQDNYLVWVLKGKSAGWQSTIDHYRLEETIAAYAKAMEFVPEDEQEALATDIVDEFSELSYGLLSLRCDRFSKWVDNEEREALTSDYLKIKSAFESFATQVPKVGDIVTHFEVISKAYASNIKVSISNALAGKMRQDYLGSDNRPQDINCEKYLEGIRQCLLALIAVIEVFAHGDEEIIIDAYNIQLVLYQLCIDCIVYKYDYDGNLGWVRCPYLSWSGKEKYKDLMASAQNDLDKFKVEIKARKEAEERARIKEYWDNHPEEKAKLDKELKEVFSQIADLEKDIAQIPGMERMNDIEASIKALQSEQKELGIFKAKEKKALQEKIDALNSEKRQVNDVVMEESDPINEKISVLIKQKKEIEKELRKPR